MSAALELCGQNHSFDLLLAQKYGIVEAILLHNFLHWIGFNKRAGRNFHEGKTWTYQSRKEMAAHFPYMDDDTIRRACERLIERGVIITGNFNKSRMDKTLWYAFANEKAWGLDDETQKMFTKGINATSKGVNATSYGVNATPIPNTIPNTRSNDDDDRDKKLSDEIGSLTVIKTDGTVQSMKIEDIFKHFLKHPYSTETVKEAIRRVKKNPNNINNVLKYLESVCATIEREKSDTVSQPKKGDKKIKKKTQEVIEEETINFEEYLKKNNLRMPDL